MLPYHFTLLKYLIHSILCLSRTNLFGQLLKCSFVVTKHEVEIACVFRCTGLDCTAGYLRWSQKKTDGFKGVRYFYTFSLQGNCIDFIFIPAGSFQIQCNILKSGTWHGNSWRWRQISISYAWSYVKLLWFSKIEPHPKERWREFVYTLPIKYARRSDLNIISDHFGWVLCPNYFWEYCKLILNPHLILSWRSVWAVVLRYGVKIHNSILYRPNSN